MALSDLRGQKRKTPHLRDWFFLPFSGFRRIGVPCRKLKPIISTTSESAFLLPSLTEGYPPMRGTHEYIYKPPRALWGCGRAQKNHQIELALSNGGLSLREEPMNIYICLLGPSGGVDVQKNPQIEHSGVVDIMGFNFRHVTPILRKTEKWRKSQSRRWGVFRFRPPKSTIFPPETAFLGPFARGYIAI